MPWVAQSAVGAWHGPCLSTAVVESATARLGEITQMKYCLLIYRSVDMTWTKPEAEVVAVTMEVTAYVATL
jgi:hypothetical protein